MKLKRIIIIVTLLLVINPFIIYSQSIESKTENDSETKIDINFAVPAYARRGDIVMTDLKNHDSEWAIPGNCNDHGGIYLGHDYKDGTYFIHSAGPNGVGYYTYDEYRSWAENFTFFYVSKVNNTQIGNAISWGIDRIGLKYQHFFPPFFIPTQWYRCMMELGLKCADVNDKSVKTSNRFYCMEYIWAAYYNQGIDIDQNGWESLKTIPNSNYPRFFRFLWDKFGWSHIYVDGFDIINSENTTLRSC